MSFRTDFSGSSALIRLEECSGAGSKFSGWAETEASAESSRSGPGALLTAPRSRVLPLGSSPPVSRGERHSLHYLVATTPVLFFNSHPRMFFPLLFGESGKERGRATSI